MRINHKIIPCIILFLVLGCASVPSKKEYAQTIKEVEDILRNNNLTPEQKVVLRHAVSELKGAQDVAKQNAELHQKVEASAEKAGAGKLVYAFIGLAGLFAVVWIVSKFSKIFP